MFSLLREAAARAPVEKSQYQQHIQWHIFDYVTPVPEQSVSHLKDQMDDLNHKYILIFVSLASAKAVAGFFPMQR